MKHILALLVITLFSISANAQASESVSSYILQKQFQAAQIKRHSEMKVVQLRNHPKDSATIVNITPKVDTGEVSMDIPSAEDLNAIESAAGGSSDSIGDLSKAAKISVK